MPRATSKRSEGDYTHAGGGSYLEHDDFLFTNGTTTASETVCTLAPDGSTTEIYTVNVAGWSDQAYVYGGDGLPSGIHFTDSGGDDFYYIGSLSFANVGLAQELGSLSWQSPVGTDQWKKTSKVKLMLHIGGRSAAGDQVLVAVADGGGTEQTTMAPYSQGIAATDLTVEGLGRTLSSAGTAYGTAASGSTVSVNLTAPVNYHSFYDGASAPIPTWLCVATTPTNRIRATIGVAEEVDLSLNPAPSDPVTWATSSGTISGTRLMAPDTPDTTKVTATVTDADGRSAKIDFPPFDVIKPSGAILVNIPGSINTQKTPFLWIACHAYWFIPPDNVSFYNISIIEGATNATTTGYFSQTNWPQHTSGGQQQGSTVIPGLGTWCSGYFHFDDITAGTLGPPYTNGTFIYHIPWSYITPRSTNQYYFTTVDHFASLTAATTNSATLLLKKGGAGGSISTP